jgi:16S rRNA (adenine1518-N6/adenine1519-N6)-dimethyltransferase
VSDEAAIAGEEREPTYDTRALLARHGLRPKRHFGQNFLLDRHLARRIAELSAPPGALVVEIGAGLGALTTHLLSRARAVVAIERDRDLVPALRETFAADSRASSLRIVEADAKTFDYAHELEGSEAPRAITGNLPYQITGPLLQRLVELAPCVEVAGVLVQLEVAERITAKPGTREYGALSVFLQAAYAVARPLVVKRGAFFPQPGVDSALVVLSPRQDRVEETPWFRKLVKSAFSQRRKQLRNAWRGLLPDDELADMARRAGVELERRGETLSVGEFARAAVEASHG